MTYPPQWSPPPDPGGFRPASEMPRTPLRPVETSRAGPALLFALLPCLVAAVAPFFLWFGMSVDDFGEFGVSGWGRSTGSFRVPTGQPGVTVSVDVDTGFDDYGHWILGPVSDGFVATFIAASTSLTAYLAARRERARSGALVVTAMALAGIGWNLRSHRTGKESFDSQLGDVPDIGAFGSQIEFVTGNGWKVSTVAFVVVALAGVVAATARSHRALAAPAFGSGPPGAGPGYAALGPRGAGYPGSGRPGPTAGQPGTFGDPGGFGPTYQGATGPPTYPDGPPTYPDPAPPTGTSWPAPPTRWPTDPNG